MKLICIFIISYLVNSGHVLGQATFKVLDNRSFIYLFAPNPISYSRYGSLQQNIRLNAFNGALDSIDNQAVWTPNPIYDTINQKFGISYLLIEEFTENEWKAIDTIYPGHRRILPDDYTVEPRPLGWHAYPNLERFSSVKPSLDFEFSHLSVDSMTKVLSYDVVLFDSNKVAIDTLQNMTNQQAEKVKDAINSSEDIKFVQFVNVILESKLWLGDRFRRGKVNNSMIYSVRI